jgi:leucyl aminopeptidase
MNLININQKKIKKIISINVIGNKNKISTQNQLRFKALEEGTFLQEI